MRELLDAAQKAIGFARGRSEADVQDDAMLLFALVRALESVGEASKQVSPSFRAAHPGIPWQQMARTRDRLIHGYATEPKAPTIVWRIVRDDLPSVVAALERSLENG